MLKSTTNSQPAPKPKDFPKLMKGTISGAIFLVTKANGPSNNYMVLVVNGVGNLLGKQISQGGWAVINCLPNTLIDYDGIVTLSNE